MKINIIAENKAEEKMLKAKEVGYKGVTDYYLDVRWVEGKVVRREESKSSGDIGYLIGRMHVAIVYLEELFKRGIK